MATMVMVVAIASLITSLSRMRFDLQLLSLLNLTCFWLTKETPVSLAVGLMVGVMVYLTGVVVIIYAYIYACDCVYMRCCVGMVGLVRPLIGHPLVILSSTIRL
jgi:hypothetical protein